MISIEQIKEPVREEFMQFDQSFKKAFESKNEILSIVNNYIYGNKGKQIRPLLTFLSAKICGKTTESTINTAIALELLHTASLIHDDIVDDTYERRGKESVNALWKNKIAVLVGDYLLSQSLHIAVKTRKIDILDKITYLGKELSDGELLQISNAKNIMTKEDKYLEVIQKKTAALFSICTSCGAISVDANKEQIEKLNEFGKIYGMCFQIKDDIFDYISTEKEIGKPVGNDIREGKITLPLLYALNTAKESEKEEYTDILRKKEFTKENVEKLINFAIEKGGIEYAKKRMDDFQQEAAKTLEIFEDNILKKHLLLTLQHTIERNK
ncbi:MAG: polyprenyl synthetase family protein [Paludibacteraceae bacterium]|nr:polyprenyl synthetase family protein [Paludibacteraceae bacterium]